MRHEKRDDSLIEDVTGLAADASLSASTEAAAAIERAAEKNEDPEVAVELQSAAIAADSTVGRVGWLRAMVHRLFGRGPR
jgi:hypothetical protein